MCTEHKHFPSKRDHLRSIEHKIDMLAHHVSHLEMAVARVEEMAKEILARPTPPAVVGLEVKTGEPVPRMEPVK